MRRLLRLTARLVLVSAVLVALTRVGVAVLGRLSGTPGGDAVRTGSFDSWPAVPSAPGRLLRRD